MQIDFSTMKVGDERPLPDGDWDSVRPVYEACTAYVKSLDKPRPQFAFEEVKPRNRHGQQRWIVRRTR